MLVEPEQQLAQQGGAHRHILARLLAGKRPLAQRHPLRPGAGGEQFLFRRGERGKGAELCHRAEGATGRRGRQARSGLRGVQRCDRGVTQCHETLKQGVAGVTFVARPAPGLCRRVATEDHLLSHSSEAAVQHTAGNAPLAGAHSSDQGGTALLAHILKSLEDDKAEEIVTIDLAGKSTIADHMVICSGRSTRQVAAISEKLVDRLKQDFGTQCKVEGKDAGDWVLIDTGDVIVHVFRPEVRDFYQLEKMWQPVTATA
ncbi:ribosome silencing factor [Vannielia litorea]|nr:ribosome silencing factor [Vannielia litorea]MBY6076562.1 ribosome silencing factor [Vannielia litorea]